MFKRVTYEEVGNNTDLDQHVDEHKRIDESLVKDAFFFTIASI